MIIFLASTYVTIPSTSETIAAPESFAARYSIPVPTIGDSGINKGTAWRCMFAPINARDASSCSKKGILEVATETSCFGDTSI